MSKPLTVTIADSVHKEIEEFKKPNRSEFVEEILRIGLTKHKETLKTK